MRLRYINRIFLPLKEGKVDLDEYLKIAPRVPDEERLKLSSFLTQQLAVDKDTHHDVSLVLTSQPPENERLPVISDVTVGSRMNANPSDWAKMQQAINRYDP